MGDWQSVGTLTHNHERPFSSSVVREITRTRTRPHLQPLPSNRSTEVTKPEEVKIRRRDSGSSVGTSMIYFTERRKGITGKRKIRTRIVSLSPTSSWWGRKASKLGSWFAPLVSINGRRRSWNRRRHGSGGAVLGFCDLGGVEVSLILLRSGLRSALANIFFWASYVYYNLQGEYYLGWGPSLLGAQGVRPVCPAYGPALSKKKWFVNEIMDICIFPINL